MAGCYGQFVMLTEPILVQATINCFPEECHSVFFLHCITIISLHNFDENPKRQKHLDRGYWRKHQIEAQIVSQFA
jgi:hypothetical protein